ncbi:glycosyltransferase [Parabacteroides sp. ZJ-118]|uniref:glycosyltransferase n=1 Tax=Parabacteroides sp. ZJ-118 TaxID=2709398 RepID=UPI0013EBDC35|nr:glycosyltransferase [Parabacteroides sp. ZJ-118]
MNILFVIPGSFSPSLGGVERVTDLLAREFLQRNHKVYFLCTYSGLDHSNSAVDVFCLSRAQESVFSDRSVCEYQKILEDNKIKIVINQKPLCEDGLFILENTPSSVKVVSVYHSKPFGDYLAKLIIWKRKGIMGKFVSLFYRYKIQQTKHIFRKIIDKSDCLCLLSGSYIKELGRFLDLEDCKKLRAINNPNIFDHGKNSLCYSAKENVLLFVGRLAFFQKNTLEFIKVWEIVSKNNPSWRAEIVGNDTGCQKEHDYVEKNRIKRCEFVGYVQDVSSYYEKASVICMTSHYEGWPMVLIEAMSRGCVPVVYKTFSAIHDIITDTNGILIEPYDINSMARGIQYLIDNPHVRSRMAVSAVDSQRKFDVSSIADEWEKLFADI